MTIGEIVKRDASGRRYYECFCDCGGVTVSRRDSLLAHTTVSCGCKYGKTPEQRSLEGKAKRADYYKREWSHRKDWFAKHRRTTRQRFMRARNAARHRGIEWGLTLEQYESVALRPCMYCNGLLGAVETRGGLDRDDNSKGYTFENSVPCCFTCNRLKSNIFTKDEFKAMMGVFLSMRGGIKQPQ